jgi:hypothetical protein
MLCALPSAQIELKHFHGDFYFSFLPSSWISEFIQNLRSKGSILQSGRVWNGQSSMIKLLSELDLTLAGMTQIGLQSIPETIKSIPPR